MSKAPDAFRTISEVAEWLETPAHVLRFWESKFSQVKPVKRAGGRRYYRPTDMLLLAGIKRLLHEDGMTIKGVQKLLRDQGAKHVAALSPRSVEEDEIVEVSKAPAPKPEPVVEEKQAEPVFTSVVPKKTPPKDPNVIQFRHSSEGQLAFPGFEEPATLSDAAEPLEMEAAKTQPVTTENEVKSAENRSINIDHIPLLGDLTTVQTSPGVLSLISKYSLGALSSQNEKARKVLEQLAAVSADHSGQGTT